MTLETFLLMIRHGLTAVGPWVIAMTPLTQTDWDTAIGAILTLAGLGWSFYRKWRRANA